MQSNTARKMQYTDSVAYDLSRFDKRKRVREALANEAVAVPAIRPRGTTRAAAKAAAEAKAVAHVSPFAILSYIAVFALLILVVTNYVKLYELSIQTANFESELVELKNDEALLKVKYERSMNIRNIEDRAAELGLYMPQGGQVTYISISQADRAEIYYTEKESKGFLNGLQKIFLVVFDFIR
jgi:hypothetical protein